MPFEIFSRKVQWGGSPAVTFTKTGRVAFNKTATKKFEDEAIENVLMMWDEARHLVGIRAISKKDARAYKIHFGIKGNGCHFSASTFLKYIGYDYAETRTFPAIWETQEAMFAVEVPEEHLKKERQHMIPVSIEGARKGK